MQLMEMFKPNTIRPGVGDRARHNETRQIGTVLGRAKVKNGGKTVFVITLRYDNGAMAYMVPENEFTKVDQTTRY